ncbi:hypothetical protein [Lachnoclostridium edouardi]|uniref:hypothetical protein n=1 Tax=Lachnoclostridium edouardi TaxID=1926283 RepID=UPI000C7C10F3|nr:hypothetical protein [Lachnoclostridium edouardi]MDO4279479.1 hypothetical protein [Lachnoclostridium edouardi]
METWRQKVGVLTMLLCLFMVLAAIWYCLFRFNLRTEGQEGTLVWQETSAWPGRAVAKEATVDL